MLSSAEAVIRFGPMRNPEIIERLYKSLRLCIPQKSVWLNLKGYSLEYSDSAFKVEDTIVSRR